MTGHRNRGMVRAVDRGSAPSSIPALALLVLSLAAGLPAAAQQSGPDVYVPAELEPWRRWVLHDRDWLACPFLFNSRAAERGDFVCAWPQTLSLVVEPGGAGFTQGWSVYGAAQWIALPGDAATWPAGVQVDGRDATVTLQSGRPSVRLGAGRHTLSGRFAWDERPRTLAVPPQTGLLTLNVDGRRIERPERDGGGVWLGQRAAEQAAQDALQVQVYRLIEDNVPARMELLMSVDVAGSMREERFGPLLPPGWLPIAVDGELPARLEADGTVRMQLRPGHWSLRLRARGPDALQQLALPEPAHNLPEAEIWSYRANERLRATAAQGPPAVDPSQVGVPPEWSELPAFRVQPGEALSISERSRGRVDADNRLHLQRQLWLDFDGTGFVFADAVGGEMQSGWRLDMAAPFTLLHATEAGENLLITEGASEGLSGVELRQTGVDLAALGRIDTRGEMPVTGWQSRFDQVRVDLNIPPGHRLLAAPGVDNAPGSWAGQWQLLDFFLLLVVTVASARLFGVAAGAVALVALALSFHELGRAGWSWLNLLAAIALVRVAPAGRLQRWAELYRAISIAVLIVILLPFLVGQLRYAIYPQLEPAGGSMDSGRVMPAAPYGAGEAPEPSLSPESAARKELRSVAADTARPVEEMLVTASRAPRSFSRYADDAVVQAGPGRPDWSWHRYTLEFAGPVDAGNSLRLVVIPDVALRLLRLLAVAAVGVFAALLLFEVLGRRPPWPIASGGGRGQGAASLGGLWLCCGLALLASPAGVRAEPPSPELLKELERRLLEPPDCAPRCADIVAASAQISADSARIELTVHAAATVAVPVPGSEDGWRAELVAAEGGTGGAVHRSDDGRLWVRIAPGQSRITVAGSLPDVQGIEIAFPEVPRRITVESVGWSVAGVREGRLVSGSLQLDRIRQQTGGAPIAAWEPARLPDFLRIRRTVQLDLDWRVETTVTRIAPEQGAISAEIPLLDGESIVSGDFRVVEGRVQIAMAATQRSVSWSSTLPRRSPLALRSAQGAPWSEVWQFMIGSVWHAEFDGVPESGSEGSGGGVRVAQFHPRGGETLTLYAERPEALPGGTLAFDTVALRSKLGLRSLNSELALRYRSTRGQQHVLELPGDAELLSVTVDARNETLELQDGRLSLPILPGEHSIDIAWQSDATPGFRVRSPGIGLGAPSSNLTIRMQLPRSRWVLFASGPDLGPAILYWSELAALILVALLLGRIELTPLRSRHWILLGLGFSTFSWGSLAIVAGWLLVSGWRGRFEFKGSPRAFNLLQVGFAALSLIALATIVVNLPVGLLGTPDMHIGGYQSSGQTLSWFADRSNAAMPLAGVYSAPLWAYKALILAWALWLSFALLSWLPWVWQSFVRDGLWRS